MGFLSVLTMAQRLAAERTPPGSIAVDATAGGGVDTLFLARTVGPGGRVYAFDVQEEALSRTRARLAEAANGAGAALGDVTLLRAGHEEMSARIPSEAHGRVRAVMFNLGYLPGGTAGEGAAGPVITKPDTTVAALDAALGLLAPGGIATIVVYPGHDGGQDEAESVDAWVAALPDEAAQAVLYRYPKRPSSPYLYALEKK